MAISKRLRFEILRRDDHTCQYCGGKAPDVTLHVDHIIPVTLGGTDLPSNLVAACKDCNLGKSSASTDSPLLDGINSRSAAYALDVTERMTRVRAVLEREAEYLDEFHDLWNRWTRAKARIPLPRDYKQAIHRFSSMGIPIELVAKGIDIAMSKTGLRGELGEFQYMAGVIWRTLDEVDMPATLSAETVNVYTELELEEKMTDQRIDAYMAGYAKAEQDMGGAAIGA